MAIDTGIWNLAGRGVKSVADYDSEFAQARQNKLSEIMTQTKVDEYQRGVKDQNDFRAALSAPGADPYDTLIRAGRVKEATDFAKGKADVAETVVKTDAGKFKLANERYSAVRNEMGVLKDAPNLTKDMVVQRGQALVNQGIFPAELYAPLVATMPDDPAQLRQWLAQNVAAQMSPKDIFEVFAPKPEKIDSGQQITFRDTNPNSPTYGQATGGPAVQKQQSPDNAASVNASLANAAATRAAAATNAAATRDAAGMARDRDTEMRLGDDYRKQSKTFQDVSEAHKTINATLNNAASSPAATLAAATKFMKLLDPGSVVRESELGMALAASGVLDRATNYYNTLKLGRVLTPNQVKDFKNITQQIYAAAQAGQKQIDANYTKQAKTYNLRPEMVIQDLGQNTAQPVDFNSLPGGGKPSPAAPKELQWGR